MPLHRAARPALAFTALSAWIGFAGCGTPGAPLPPSLNLPDRVSDLAAARTGDQVALTWTMPSRNTDKLKLTASIAVTVCRREGDGPCLTAGGATAFAPRSAANFTELLPPALASGPARELTYFVELKNSRGKSAGLSNGAAVLAGKAPPLVSGLTAENRKHGVVLGWNADASPEADASAIRLHRKLLTPAKPQSAHGPLAPEKEPAERTLLVEDAAKSRRAIDKDVRRGQTYEYSAQRVLRVRLTNARAEQQAPAGAEDMGSDRGRMLELAGPLSAPVRVEAADAFPPEAPTGLAAIAARSGDTLSIDLSWKANADADLAGYAVYRREADGPWQRISPAVPIVGPAFHDSQVQAGVVYVYGVTALDAAGHESARSQEAEETAPKPEGAPIR